MIIIVKLDFSKKLKTAVIIGIPKCCYLQQFSGYYVCGEIRIARDTFDHLIATSVAQIKRGGLVDWPAGERDGFVFIRANTVVNAFYLRVLALMAELARAVDQPADAGYFSARECAAQKVFQERFFAEGGWLYRDGEDAQHGSVHANVFPLAPGWSRAQIKPHPGSLQWSGGQILTAKDAIAIDWKNGCTFILNLKLPPGISAPEGTPAQKDSTVVLLNGKAVSAMRVDSWWILEKDVAGSATIKAK